MNKNLRIYLDNASATKPRSEVVDIVSRVMTEDYGNPSSLHMYGRQAAMLLEHARNNIAEAIGVKPKTVYFTSGGTEANNLALSGVVRNRNLTRTGRHLITSATEHDSVMAPFKRLEDDGFEVTYLMPDKAGHIPADSFAAALREDTVFASIMLVNNETGAVNPVSDYAAEIKRRGYGTILHTDAVQGFCKIRFTARALGADLISLSAHKIHGIKGAGALYAAEHIKLSPLIYGGGQESGKRAGTEALPAVSGFGEAARLGYAELEQTHTQVHKLREYTANLLQEKIPDVEIIGEGDCPYILCLSLPGFKSEVLQSYLDGEGIYVSKGSACKKGARSHVLEAMQLPDNVVDGALRVSFSRHSAYDEAERFVLTLEKAAKTLVHR